MGKPRKAMKVKQPVADESIEKEDTNDVYEVEKILDKRDSTKGLEYYVKWKGYPSTCNTWEPSANILQESLIKDFDKRQAKPVKGKPKAKAQDPPEEEEEEDEEEEDQESLGEADEEEEQVEEEEEEEEPVKAKRARTASKPTKKAPEPKPKAPPKNKNASPSVASKAPVKVKVTRRVAEPKGKPATEPKVKPSPVIKAKPVTEAKVKAAAKAKPTPIEPRRAAGRRNVPTKIATAIKKDTSFEESPEDELMDTEEKAVEPTTNGDSKAKDDGNETNDATVIVAEEMDLSKFKFTRIINESVSGKSVTFLGTYKGLEGVIRLEKTVFNEDEVKEAFGDKDTLFERAFNNDIYSHYELKPVESSLLNAIKATVIYPANDAVKAKYSGDESILFSESPDVYLKVVEPFIEDILKDASDPNRWLYNILEGLSETDRVIINDPDKDSGFMMIPDLKWSGDDKDLHMVAICHRRDIRSLRDLTDKHLVLLKNILTKGTKAIKDKYPNVEGRLRSFIHYQPSFYHFHVHFKAVNALEPHSSDRDNLLGTVINNITLKKDYYKKTSLVYPLSKSHPLYDKLEKAGRI